jgi:hypothetical protein
MVLVFIAWLTDQTCMCSEKALITILCILRKSTIGNCNALASGFVFCRNGVTMSFVGPVQLYHGSQELCLSGDWRSCA